MTLPIRLLIAVVILTVGSFGLYMLGRTDGTKITEASTLTGYQEGVKKNANIDKQTNRMAKSDLDRALSHWMHK